MSEKTSMADAVRATVEAGREQFAPPPPPVAPPPPDPTPEELKAALNRNELGDAELLARLVGDRFLYDNKDARWYVFPEGAHAWEPDVNRKVERSLESVAVFYDKEGARLYDVADEMETEGQDAKAVQRCRDLAGKFIKRASDLRSRKRISNVLHVASSGGRFSLGFSGDRWNEDPELLPVGNCVINLRTAEGRPGEPGQYFNRACQVEYRGMFDESPFWEDFLAKLFCGDENLRDWVELLVGYSVTGYADRKEFLFAYGPQGNNGKSVFFETIARILGSWATKIPVGTLYEERYQRNGGAPSPELLLLDGRRFVFTSEATDKRYFDMTKLKDMVGGGDVLKIRGLHKDFVDVLPKFALWVHSNKIPQISGNDPAFRNRLRIIPFRARFVSDPDEVDEANHVYLAIPRSEIEEILRKEAPGILAWLARCAKRYLAAVKADSALLDPPACVLQESQEYWAEQDEVGEFLESCSEADPDCCEQMNLLHATYRVWLIEEKSWPKDKLPSLHTLNADLKMRPNLRRKKTNVVVWFGVRLHEEWRVKGEDFLESEKAKALSDRQKRAG